MKIICIGRNYVEHIQELGNEIPQAPIIFLKPDTALLRSNAPFYFPDFSKDIHHEVELIVKISREAKKIDAAFASKYYTEIGIGIDFTARDLQATAKEKGLPWDLCKGFNGGAPISDFQPLGDRNIDDLKFHLEINGKIVQEGHTAHMIHSTNQMLAYVSNFISLKTGDIVFTGTPSGVGPVKVGDKLKGYLEGELVLDFEVK